MHEIRMSGGLDLQSTPGGSDEPIDFTEFHAGAPRVGLDAENRIVFCTGTKAPGRTYALIAVLKA
jgi:hypothetical protein